MDVVSESDVRLRIITEYVTYIDDYIYGEGSGPTPDVSLDNNYDSLDYQCVDN